MIGTVDLEAKARIDAKIARMVYPVACVWCQEHVEECGQCDPVLLISAEDVAGFCLDTGLPICWNCADGNYGECNVSDHPAPPAEQEAQR